MHFYAWIALRDGGVRHAEVLTLVMGNRVHIMHPPTTM